MRRHGDRRQQRLGYKGNHFDAVGGEIGVEARADDGGGENRQQQQQCRVFVSVQDFVCCSGTSIQVLRC